MISGVHKMPNVRLNRSVSLANVALVCEMQSAIKGNSVSQTDVSLATAAKIAIVVVPRIFAVNGSVHLVAMTKSVVRDLFASKLSV
jgi:hypothetical protein